MRGGAHGGRHIIRVREARNTIERCEPGEGGGVASRVGRTRSENAVKSHQTYALYGTYEGGALPLSYSSLCISSKN
eukprot:358451-Chlamydomonas_euryale.AAC.2